MNNIFISLDSFVQPFLRGTTDDLSSFKKQFQQKEIDADSFASELLLPRDQLKTSIENVQAQTVEDAILLFSHLYQVSFAAMAYRLYSLEMITRARYDKLGKVNPTKLGESIGRKVPTRPFHANAVLTPLISDQLKLSTNPRVYSGSSQEDSGDGIYSLSWF
jgi:Zn-dependent peptidase ImmA (M78 family)